MDAQKQLCLEAMHENARLALRLIENAKEALDITAKNLQVIKEASVPPPYIEGTVYEYGMYEHEKMTDSLCYAIGLSSSALPFLRHTAQRLRELKLLTTKD